MRLKTQGRVKKVPKCYQKSAFCMNIEERGLSREVRGKNKFLAVLKESFE